MARSRYYVKDGTPDATDRQAAAFAQRLHTVMLSKGMNQADVTREAQKYLPPGTTFGRHLVSSWLRGRYLPHKNKMDILCKALGVTVTELVPEKLIKVVKPEDQAVQVSMSTSGMARLKLDMELPADVALKIMALANEARKGS